LFENKDGYMCHGFMQIEVRKIVKSLRSKVVERREIIIWYFVLNLVETNFGVHLGEKVIL